MRIVAGTARGTKLESPKGMRTRPTLERVKEGMFSTLQFQLPGAVVLDLFAGSGQLGLEALSRGASRCTFVDEDRAACNLVRKNAESAGLEKSAHIICGDSVGMLKRVDEKYDLVLLDPPYNFGKLDKLLCQAAPVCVPGGIIMCETGRENGLPDNIPGLVLKKQYKYGDVLVGKYICAQED